VVAHEVSNNQYVVVWFVASVSKRGVAGSGWRGAAQVDFPFVLRLLVGTRGLMEKVFRTWIRTTTTTSAVMHSDKSTFFLLAACH